MPSNPNATEKEILSYVAQSREKMERLSDQYDSLDKTLAEYEKTVRDEINKKIELLDIQNNKLDAERQRLEDNKRISEEEKKIRLEGVRKRKKMLDDEINAQRNKMSGLSSNLSMAKTKIETNDKKEAKINVLNKLTNDRYTNFSKASVKVDNFGAQLSKIGGKGLGGFGKAISGAGKMLGKLAGPAAIAIKALEGLSLGLKMAKERRNLNAKQDFERKIENEQMNLRRLQGESEIKIQKKGLEAQLQSITFNAVQQTQREQIQFAQSVASEYAKLGVEGNKIGLDAYTQSHKMMSDAPFDIKGAAYAAANNAIDLAGRINVFGKRGEFAGQKIGIQQENLEKSLETISKNQEAESNAAVLKTQAALKLTSLNTQEDIDQLLREQRANEVKRQNEKTELNINQTDAALGFLGLPGLAGMADSFVSGGLDRKYNEIVADYGAKYENIKKEERILAAKTYTDIFSKETDMFTEYQKTQNTLNLEALKANNAIIQSGIEVEQNIATDTIEASKEIAKSWMNMSQKLNDEFLKMEDASTKMGRQMGIFGANLQKFNYSVSQLRQVAAEFGKNTEWIAQMQSSYQEASGRNAQFSDVDLRMLGASSTLLGDDIVQSLNNGMEIFNSSIADSNTQILKMFNSVSKIGLNGKKYAKDLAKNLQLAEKYNFKNGVKSLMEMSKWAQNMRFNVSSMDGMINKVQSGGLEGIIKQSAELQVLGGNFAMGSDPLAMAYESFADPEAYAKRLNSMLKGMGTFNTKTGQTEFAPSSMMMLRQFAETTGMDIKDVLNQIRQQDKSERVKSVLSGDLTEEQQSLIVNKAKYDAETGQWNVIGSDGKTKINVSDINSGNISQVGAFEEDSDKTMAETQKAILDNITSAFSSQENYNNAQEIFRSKLETELWKNQVDTNNTVVKFMTEEFEKNKKTYLDKYITGLDGIANANNTFARAFNKGNEKVDTALKDLNTTLNSLPSELKSSMESAAAYIARIAGLKVDAPTLKEPNKNDDNDAKLADTITYIDKFNDEQYKIFKDILGSKNAGKYFKNGTWFDGLYEIDTSSSEAIEEINKLIRENKDGIQDKLKNAANNVHIETIATPGGMPYMYYSGGPSGAYGYDDKVVSKKIKDLTNRKSLNDGFIAQNGSVVNIDSNDQVLAAKNGGPIDKMLNAIPRSMPYTSNVMETPYGINGVSNNNQIQVAPIQIQINGSIQINGGGGVVDVTEQLTNNPEFIRALSQVISSEVEKKVQGGKTVSPLNRGLSY